MPNESPLLTLKQFAKKHPAFTEAMLRSLVYWNRNGFGVCVRRLGRRVFLVEREFFAWVDRTNGQELRAGAPTRAA